VRLLFLSSTGQCGGAEAALLELLAGLRGHQPEWQIGVVAASDGPFVERLRQMGVAANVVPFPPRLARLGEWAAAGSPRARVRFVWSLAVAAAGIVGYLRRLSAAVRAARPDIVQSNGIKMHLLAPWVAPRGGSVIWHVHDYVGKRSLSSTLLRWMAPWCAAVFANSDSVAEDLRRALGSRVRVHRVWNAVDLERYSTVGPALDLDALAGLPRAVGPVTRVGLVATFARWKGHATFLRALGMLPDSLGVRGYIVGGPVYTTDASQVSLEELKRVTGSEGLDGRVGFVGHVANSADAMRALDIIVHASTEPEPFGLVIAEGMACGRAVIVSGAGGAREIVTPGVTALVHEPGDAQGLAERIRLLVTDGDLRARVAAAARDAAEHAFERSRMVSEISPVYRLLAGGRV